MTVESWKEKLYKAMKKMISGILTKQDCFDGYCLKKAFAKNLCNLKEETMKQQMTIAFVIIATGKKEKPIVIWKSANP